VSYCKTTLTGSYKSSPRHHLNVSSQLVCTVNMKFTGLVVLATAAVVVNGAVLVPRDTCSNGVKVRLDGCHLDDSGA
jgi:hypothetical protein